MSSNKTPGLEWWLQRRGRIYSRTGGWVMGKGVYTHGFDMMNELVGHMSYMQVVILNATGKLVSREMADWCEAIHICLSWPDPRIWCNQIGALAGETHSSATSAMTAGVMASEAKKYGSKTLIKGMEFIQQAYQDYESGLSIKEIVDSECAKYGGKPLIMGYARPIAKGDERIPAMERVSRSLGFEVGAHLRLAYDIEQELNTQFGEGMNINGYMSAFLSDQGFSSEDTHQIFINTVASGVTACYLDVRQSPTNGFLPLQCDDIEYTGKAARPLPPVD